MSSYYKSIISDEEEDLQSRKLVDKWIFRMFLLLLGFMPLIVLAHTEEVISPLISNVTAITGGVKGELFTHYKAMFIIIITVISSLLFLSKIIFMNGTVRKTPLNYILGVFAIIIVLSTIFSPSAHIALSGTYNRSDGAISWLCYIALLFIAMNIEYPKNFVRYIMYTMMPFVYINLYIIAMNFYGKDLLANSQMFNKIVTVTLPEGASLNEGSQLLGTLNQWNYMSGMFAAMTVMYLAWAIVSKKWYETLIGTITAVVSIAVMFMSISTSGFLTVAILMAVIIVVLFTVPNKKQAMISFAIFIACSGVVLHMLASHNPKVWAESFGFVIEKNPYVQDSPVSFVPFENKVYASDEQLTLPTLPESAVSAGSGRAYIWAKTLDLVKERPFLGYGVDTILYHFSHFDIDARAGMGTEKVIVDKPHSVYVGTLYGFGIIGFITFLGVLLFAAIASIKSIQVKNLVMIVVAFPVMAYFIQGLFNDSLPGTTAIAFVLTGMLLGVYGQMKEEISVDGRND